MNPAIHRAADRHADQYAVKTAVLNEVRDAFVAGAQVYPIRDGEPLVLGPECFATDAPLNDPGPDTKIAWKGVWFGILPDADPTIGLTLDANGVNGLPEGYLVRDKDGDLLEAGDPDNLASAHWAPFTVVGKVEPRKRPNSDALFTTVMKGANWSPTTTAEFLKFAREHGYEVTPTVNA